MLRCAHKYSICFDGVLVNTANNHQNKDNCAPLRLWNRMWTSFEVEWICFSFCFFRLIGQITLLTIKTCWCFVCYTLSTKIGLPKCNRKFRIWVMENYWTRFAFVLQFNFHHSSFDTMQFDWKFKRNKKINKKNQYRKMRIFHFPIRCRNARWIHLLIKSKWQQKH